MIVIVAVVGLAYETMFPIMVHGATTDKIYDAQVPPRPKPVPIPPPPHPVPPTFDSSLRENERIETSANASITRQVTLDPSHFIDFKDKVTLWARPMNAKQVNDPIIDQAFVDLSKGVVRGFSTVMFVPEANPPPPASTKVIIRTKGVTTGSRGTSYCVCVDSNQTTTVWNMPHQLAVQAWSANTGLIDIPPGTGRVYLQNGSFGTHDPITVLPACIASLLNQERHVAKYPRQKGKAPVLKRRIKLPVHKSLTGQRG
jgi:hypothetical protein